MRIIENDDVWSLLTDSLESGSFRLSGIDIFQNEAPPAQATQKSREAILKERLYALASFTCIHAEKKPYSPREKSEHELFELEQEGKFFGSNIFVRLWHHYYLKERFEGTDYCIIIDLCRALHDHLGNALYYEANQNVVSELLSLGSLLSPCLTREQCDASESKLKQKAKAAVYLRSFGIDLTLIQGSFMSKDDSEIFNLIERRIASVTGNRVLEYLFNSPFFRERFPYIPVIDRLLIARPIDNSQEDIPYGLLLNLAAKHLKPTVGASLEAVKYTDAIEEIIRLSKAWLTIMDISGDSGIEYATMSVSRFPEYMIAGMLYDKLCIPAQYGQRYIMLLLEHLIRPWFEKASTEYSYRQYRNVAEYILTSKKWGAPVTVDELHIKLGIGKRTCEKILEAISIRYDRINQDYNAPNAPTNLWRYPVIRFPQGKYYCFNQLLCGIGFFLLASQMIKDHFSLLDRKQGEKVEELLRSELRKKGVKVLDGKYSKTKGFPNGQIDAALVGKRTLLFEVKKSSCFEEFDAVDDVALFSTLGKGMVHAQKQCFAHERYLNGVGRILLENGEELKADATGNPIFKVSVCLSEYSFLTSKPFTQVLMKTILLAEVKAKEEGRNLELSRLSELSKIIRELAVDRVDGTLDVQKQSFYSMFCSLQQMLNIVWLFDDADELMDALVNLAYCTTPSLDQYIIILTAYDRAKNGNRGGIDHKQIIDALLEKGMPVAFYGV